MTLGCTLCGQFQQFYPTDETDYSHPHTQLHLEVLLHGYSDFLKFLVVVWLLIKLTALHTECFT